MQLPFSGLPSGNYTMSVAALGPLARSGEASITVNIDGPPVPEACVVQSTIESISLFPSNVQHGLNGEPMNISTPWTRRPLQIRPSTWGRGSA